MKRWLPPCYILTKQRKEGLMFLLVKAIIPSWGAPPSWPHLNLTIPKAWLFFFSADKVKDFIGKGCLGGEQQGKGPRENDSATELKVSGFMVMGLVSRLSLAIISLSPCVVIQGPSWVHVHLSAKTDSITSPKALLTNSIMWGVRVSTYELPEGHKHSAYNKYHPKKL